MSGKEPKIEWSASKRDEIPPAQDLPKPPPEPQISPEEIQRSRSEDKQQIREIKSSLGLEVGEVADEDFERAENFKKGVALLRDKVNYHRQVGGFGGYRRCRVISIVEVV